MPYLHISFFPVFDGIWVIANSILKWAWEHCNVMGGWLLESLLKYLGNSNSSNDIIGQRINETVLKALKCLFGLWCCCPGNGWGGESGRLGTEQSSCNSKKLSLTGSWKAQAFILKFIWTKGWGNINHWEQPKIFRAIILIYMKICPQNSIFLLACCLTLRFKEWFLF